MTNFQIAWTIAGFIIGWIGIEFLGKAISTRLIIPWIFNLALGFVGALIAYTLTK